MRFSEAIKFDDAKDVWVLRIWGKDVKSKSRQGLVVCLLNLLMKHGVSVYPNGLKQCKTTAVYRGWNDRDKVEEFYVLRGDGSESLPWSISIYYQAALWTEDGYESAAAAREQIEREKAALDKRLEALAEGARPQGLLPLTDFMLMTVGQITGFQGME